MYIMYRHGLLVRIAHWVSVPVEKRHAERQDWPSVGAPKVDWRWWSLNHESRDDCHG
jgi:hypothetical protein